MTCTAQMLLICRCLICIESYIVLYKCISWRFLMDTQVLASFGKQLKKLRMSKGLSQEKFALKIGMDRTYYASVENGKRNVSLINIKKIADGLELSLSELFREI